MTDPGRRDVTLSTLHEDLTSGFGEMRAGFTDLKASVGDLKATLVAGFRGLPTRESSEEMVRLLREANRQQDARFSQLDVRIREQHLETQQVLHALVEGQRALVEGQRLLTNETRSLSADIKALISRIDALIRRRGDGSATA